jgi:pilus assembly protein CpaE
VLSLFKRLGYDRTKVKIVINRYLPKNPLTVNEIEDRLDHDVYETLDNHFPFVSSLIEQGRLARDVNIKHPVTQGFDRLASRLLGMEPPKTKGGLFSIFSRFRRS